jgi:ribosomal protein S18 acetylase RimI-like enzyme
MRDHTAKPDTVTIRALEPGDVEPVVALALRAWAPVFVSIEEAYGSTLFERWYPGGDWRPAQEAAVRQALADLQTAVAVDDVGAVIGYASVSYNREESMGELHMIAVDPDAQQRGVGSRLTAEAVERIRAAGMTIAMIETGSDPGHAPARATYAKAGFRHVPISRYFLAL